MVCIAFGFLIWGVLGRKMTRVAMVAAGICVVLAVGALLDVNLPSPGERGAPYHPGNRRPRYCSGQSRSRTDVTGSDNVAFYRGTITWRETWWRAIWANSQDNYHNLIIGPGYGFPLKKLVSYLNQQGELRTPHNVFYYALGYTGWIGVVLFVPCRLLAAC